MTASAMTATSTRLFQKIGCLAGRAPATSMGSRTAGIWLVFSHEEHQIACHVAPFGSAESRRSVATVDGRRVSVQTDGSVAVHRFSIDDQDFCLTLKIRHGDLCDVDARLVLGRREVGEIWAHDQAGDWRRQRYAAERGQHHTASAIQMAVAPLLAIVGGMAGAAFIGVLAPLAAASALVCWYATRLGQTRNLLAFQTQGCGT